MIQAKFVASGLNKDSWPVSDLPEIVLAGRSNVGKSSLINALFERKNLAYVGKTPGKTRLLNFFNVSDEWMMVDAPGYGYAKRSKEEMIQFGNVMESYFRQRENLKALLLIVDYRHKPTQDDLGMVEFATFKNIPIIICCTKKDKCKRSELHKLKKQIAETLNVDAAQCIDFSSVTKEGVAEVHQRIEELLNQQ